MKIGVATVGAVVLICNLHASAALVQWRAVDGGNDHWYGLTVSIGSWGFAQTEALSLGGDLASISSAEENAFVLAVATAPSSGTTFATWLGLRRDSATTSWYWSDGTSADYFNWATGEPNNATGNEFFGWMYTPSNGGVWNDHNQSDYALRGVIEVVPAPGTLSILGLCGLRIRSRR